MKKLTFPGALLLLLLGTGVAGLHAKTLRIPEDKPVLSVDVPSSWETDDLEKGVQVKSADGEAQIFFEVTSAKKIDALIDENIDYLKENKVVIDESTKQESDFEFPGMKGKTLTWDAKDEFGPESVALVFGKVSDSKMLMITYWVTKKSEKKHGDEIAKVMNSVTVLK